jgi:hypothetical protein
VTIECCAVSKPDEWITDACLRREKTFNYIVPFPLSGAKKRAAGSQAKILHSKIASSEKRVYQTVPTSHREMTYLALTVSCRATATKAVFAWSLRCFAST